MQREAEILGATCKFASLPLYEHGQVTEEDVALCHSILDRVQPDIILLPNTFDRHPTHQQVLQAMLLSLQERFEESAGTRSCVELLMYETPWGPFFDGSSTSSLSSCGFNTVFHCKDSSVWDHKRLAVESHKSQLERNDFLGMAECRARLNASLVREKYWSSFGGGHKEIGCGRAEFYRRLYITKASQVEGLLLELKWDSIHTQPAPFV